MRDAVAVLLAKVIRSALAQILQVSAGDVDGMPRVSLLLAGNQLHQLGIAAILGATADAGARISHLDIERNRLDITAAEWLADWCARQPGGPPDELYLSHNKLGDMGALRLLASLGIPDTSGSGATARRRVLPIWIELSENRIRHTGKLLDHLSEQIPVCLALDRDVCGPAKCAGCEDNTSSQDLPRLHLHNILDQGGADQEGQDGHHDKSAAKPFRVKQEPGTSAASASVVAQKPQPGTAVKKEDVGAKVKKEDVDAVVKAEPPSSELAAGEAKTNGRGRGRGRGRGKAAAARDSGGAEGEAPQGKPHPAVQVEERKSWAMSLGKKRRSEAPAFEYCVVKDEPPSCGLWDLIKQPPPKRRRPQSAARSAPASGAPGNAPQVPSASPLHAPASVMQGGGAASDAALAFAVNSAVIAAEMPSCAAASSHAVSPGPTMPVSSGVISSPLASDAGAGNAGAPGEDENCAEEDEKARFGLGNHIDSTLQKVIQERLERSRKLFYDLEGHHKKLRVRCLSTQLTRKAQEKYLAVVVGSADSWKEYLATAAGHKRIIQWVDKKIDEITAKRNR
eukprot:gnl/TRDRNA2_/TRDRNA2_156403_c1_seq1.p1 gnl/TRDRNA2_/TRDRNA2_156403_c1~~gnl/TRDRNA2_/TRDRNA2_156403_c1_seq1.p1  ORF type:complete len:609 (+),score=104.70 gnl/TRDRNA2_/TRDRNA2_156403_c1_seq1:127-1827(+)